MLIPAAAIWGRAACCHHSVTPNPAVPVALSSQPDNRWELHTPAATCADAHALCMFVCACEGACCASIFAARISDKLNESPESCYLLAYSCSALSSLFSGSVFPFLLSFYSALPTSRCLYPYALPFYAWWGFASISTQAPFICSGYTSASPLTPEEVKWSKEDFAVHHVD